MDFCAGAARARTSVAAAVLILAVLIGVSIARQAIMSSTTNAASSGDEYGWPATLQQLCGNWRAAQTTGAYNRI
jgi:hypothetical protein